MQRGVRAKNSAYAQDHRQQMARPRPIKRETLLTTVQQNAQPPRHRDPRRTPNRRAAIHHSVGTWNATTPARNKTTNPQPPPPTVRLGAPQVPLSPCHHAMCVKKVKICPSPSQVSSVHASRHTYRHKESIRCWEPNIPQNMSMSKCLMCMQKV